MVYNIKAFNEIGRQRWAESLVAMRNNKSLLELPQELEDMQYYSEVPVLIEIERREFTSKYELAEYLHPKIAILKETRISESLLIGIWDWLAYFYFDLLCPIKNGVRILKEQARYSYDSDWKRKYRHRIAEPCGLYERHEQASRIFLYGSPTTISDMEEQASSRLAINSNSHVAQAMMTLYWDENLQKPKKGAAATKRQPGTLRRFSDLLLQLERTYDLDVIGYQGILELLPQREYKKWLPR